MKSFVRWIPSGISTALPMLLAAAGVAAAAQVGFQGNHSRNFSDDANWSAFPQPGDHIMVSSRAATEAAPAILDAEFSVPLGLARIFSGGNLGLETAHVEVAGGATLNALAVIVGNNANKSFDGRLVLRKGASMKPTHPNSGSLAIGGDGDGMSGEVVEEAGVLLFSHAKLELHRNGRLTFVVGPEGVTPFTVTNTFKEETHALNGVLAVDLGGAPVEGALKLIDGAASKVALGGGLVTWLQGTGGAVSGNGDFTGENFIVTGAAGKSWALAADGRDLVLRLGGASAAVPHEKAPPPETPAAVAGTAPSGKLPPPVDLTTWDLASWRAWPFDYEELSTRKAPLAGEEGADWVRTGDSWVAEKKDGGKTTRVVLKPETLFTELKITDFYITGGGNAGGPNRIFCASAVPEGIPGPFPVLLVFHGGGGHGSGALALATARRNPGFAAVAVDYNGQFFASKQPVTKWVTVTQELRSQKLDLDPNPLNFPMYHYAQAARRVLDWAEEQPWADKGKLGAVGISYGGWMAYFLAGNDPRIRSVYAAVSAGGTEGMRGRSCQAHDWEPAEQRAVWMKYADPIRYAAGTKARVFMRLAADDRFFWIDGAANHRAAFEPDAEWLVTPNCDHGNGGPELAEPSALWHRAVFFGETPLPEIGEVVFDSPGRNVTAPVKSARKIASVFMAWSPGRQVSPARYWQWIPAIGKGAAWTAEIPAGFEDLEGVVYFTATDVDGRAVSSGLSRKTGRPVESAVVWAEGCLWDAGNGPAAWRADLSFGKIDIGEAGPGRVVLKPAKADGKAAVFTNSLILPAAVSTDARCLRIELSGNGAAVPVKVILARDYNSLDQQLFAADAVAPPQPTVVDLPWSGFAPHGRETKETSVLPANGLVIECARLPAGGLTIGPVTLLFP